MFNGSKLYSFAIPISFFHSCTQKYVYNDHYESLSVIKLRNVARNLGVTVI